MRSLLRCRRKQTGVYAVETIQEPFQTAVSTSTTSQGSQSNSSCDGSILEVRWYLSACTWLVRRVGAERGSSHTWAPPYPGTAGLPSCLRKPCACPRDDPRRLGLGLSSKMAVAEHGGEQAEQRTAPHHQARYFPASGTHLIWEGTETDSGNTAERWTALGISGLTHQGQSEWKAPAAAGPGPWR